MVRHPMSLLYGSRNRIIEFLRTSLIHDTGDRQGIICKVAFGNAFYLGSDLADADTPLQTIKLLFVFDRCHRSDGIGTYFVLASHPLPRRILVPFLVCFILRNLKPAIPGKPFTNTSERCRTSLSTGLILGSWS